MSETTEGNKLARHCTNCGERQQPGASFCASCGAAMAKGPETGPFSAPSQADVPGQPIMGVQAATVCTACNRQNALDRRFCQWCSQFLIKSGGIQRYAGFGRRLGAYIIDFLGPYGLFMTVFLFGWRVAGSSGGAVAYLVLLGWFVLQLIFWSRGTTFGKMLLGARVIRIDRSAAGFGMMFVREFIAKGIVAPIVAVLTFGIGWLIWYLWALWDRNSQALHDKFMSTLVVHE